MSREDAHNPLIASPEDTAVTASEMEYEVPANKKHQSFSTHNARRQSILKTCKSWKWELVACFVSIITFVFNVVFLRSFDGKPQPEWPHGITLNSVMSLFSMVIKSLLLVPVVECISQLMWISYSSRAQPLEKFAKYDAASRGPWGSLKLVWETKARELACLGALLTILTTAIDPTMQQMLVIRTRYTNQKGTAFIPRAQSYLKAGPHEATRHHASENIGLVGSVYAGLYTMQTNSSGIFEVSPTCPTGSCTFPAFASLAVCTRCKDMTEAVETTCSRNYNVTHPAFNSTKICQYNVSDNSSQQNISVSMQQNFFVSSVGFNTTSISLAISDLVEEFFFPSIACSSRGDSFRVLPSAGEFLHVITIKGDTKPNQTMSVKATSCTMSFCSNHYETSVVDGKLFESVIESESLILDSTPVQSARSMNTSVQYYIFHDSQGLNYTVDQAVLQGLSVWLGSKFNFNNAKPFKLKGSGSDDTTFGAKKRDSNYTIIYAPTISYFPNPELEGKEDIINLFLANDTESSLIRLSTALTTYIRSQSKEDQMYPTLTNESENTIIDYSFAGPFEGFTQVTEVYVAVRWEWLSFSGILLVATWAFFVLVMIFSEKKNVAVWKTSPLALLYHGLHGDSVGQLRSATEEKTMKRTAKQIKVQLRDSGSGLMLEKVD